MSSSPSRDFLISELTLRKLLGILGFILPIILVAGVYLLKELFDIGEHATDRVFQPSVSHYYYTVMGDVFVAVVASFGLFLFTYRGYHSEKIWKRDNIFTNTGGVFAVLVALFPTGQKMCGFGCYVHFVAATAFFLILSYISLVLFTESKDPPEERPRPKVLRNRVYRVCGVTMLCCIVILAIYFATGGRNSGSWPANTVFIFEAIALWAFGISWLTKGEALFPDA